MVTAADDLHALDRGLLEVVEASPGATPHEVATGLARLPRPIDRLTSEVEAALMRLKSEGLVDGLDIVGLERRFWITDVGTRRLG